MNRLPYLSIALVSAAALAYEILLMRLFGMIQWHHFAYMVISLALLGYGASGTFLSLAKNVLLRYADLAYFVMLLLFSVSSLLSFLLAQRIAFDPMELLWDHRQLVQLLWLYLLLALPFFFVATAIGLMFIRYSFGISKLYSANLVGSGLGSLGILYLLSLFFPESILQIISLFALLAAAVAVWEMKSGINAGILLLFTAALAAIFLFGSNVTLRMNEYKDLSQTLRIGGMKIIEERSSALERLTVVESSDIPFRYVPGLSMAWSSEPPEQLAVFMDGNGMSVITKMPEKREALQYLDYQTSALAYHLKHIDSTFIVGAGGGTDILQALYHKVEKIEAVEIDPQMADLVAKRFAAFSGALYEKENVTVYTGEARAFIASSPKTFDMIQMAMVESFGASATGLYSLSENYLYTTEAIALYLSHLRPGGYLSVTRWLKLPPRDMLKLFATALEALEKSGIADPGKQLVMIRGLQTGTLLVKNGPFTSGEIEALKRFCTTRLFDMVYYDGMPPSEANRYNRLEKPVFYNGVQELLKHKESFYENYKFYVRPPNDDQPYFGHFFKWKSLPELFALRGKGGLNLLESGYLILVATLLQAIAASIVLILLPLLFQRNIPKEHTGRQRTKVLLYFFSLGFAFLFLEIYFIQKLTLFLTHPINTVAIVLGSFLIFAGLGSGYSFRLAQKVGYRTATAYAVVSIVILGLVYIWLLDPLFSVLITQGELFKATVAVALIAPVAFAMGIPFAMGLSSLGKTDEAMIPWAWGVNGCASVISAVTATLVSIHFGFLAVMLLALLFYLTALSIFPYGKKQ